MESSDTPTVQEWLRGWTLTYIPNEEEAERLAQRLHAHLETQGLHDLPLSDEVRQDLEGILGTAQDTDARSPAAVVEKILSDHLSDEIAGAAAAPLAFRTLNRGKRNLGIDIEKEVPPTLAAMIENMVRPKITEEGIERLQKVYERLGPDGLRRWLLNAN